MSKTPMDQRQPVSLRKHMDQGDTIDSGSALKPHAVPPSETVVDIQGAGLVSDLIRGADSRGVSDPRKYERGDSLGVVNPIYILIAITVGIPALLIIMLFVTNPGVQEGISTAIVTFLVISAFATAMFFEIKRLADQHSDE